MGTVSDSFHDNKIYYSFQMSRNREESCQSFSVAVGRTRKFIGTWLPLRFDLLWGFEWHLPKIQSFDVRVTISACDQLNCSSKYSAQWSSLWCLLWIVSEFLPHKISLTGVCRPAVLLISLHSLWLLLEADLTFFGRLYGTVSRIFLGPAIT